MAANIDPIFTLTPHIGCVAISTANTNRDGTGTIGTVFTAATDGSRIHRITIKATGTTTAGIVRLFLHDGSNYFLWREVLITAATPSGTVLAFEWVWEMPDEKALVLDINWSLRASTHNAESFNVIAEAGDY